MSLRAFAIFSRAINMSSKIILGTVQFGLNYGINNKTGKPSADKVFDLLNYSLDCGIDTLDTADGYGDASEVISAYQARSNKKFHIISKFTVSNNSEDIRSIFERTLARIQDRSLYAYFFHRYSDFINFTQFNELKYLKDQGLIQYLGVSIYSLDELKQVVQHPLIDIIQLPFNVFDSADEKIRLLEQARLAGKQIHVRSVFLQGLFYKNPDELAPGMMSFKENLEAFHSITQRYNLNVEELCLGFVNSLSCIDKIVIGVEDSDQLKKNLSALNVTLPLEAIADIKNIEIKNSDLIDPSKWKSK